MRTGEGLRVHQRCNQRFDAMPERDGGRFCGQCSEVVFDLSSLTFDEYQRWLALAPSERAACVHGLMDEGGRLLLKEDLEAAERERAARAKRRLPIADAALVASIALAQMACERQPPVPAIARDPAVATPVVARPTINAEAERAAREAAAREAIAAAERELRAAESADAGVASTTVATDAGVVTVLHPHPPGRHVRTTPLRRPSHFMGGAPAHFGGGGVL